MSPSAISAAGLRAIVERRSTQELYGLQTVNSVATGREGPDPIEGVES